MKNKKIIFVSGAGLDAPSGISTFRDSNGLWENHKIEEVCNIHTWRKNYKLIHKFYNNRREQLGKVKPNKAHKVIAKITSLYGEDNVRHITMNVSDLQEREGLKPLHVHGELNKIRCVNCNHVWNIGYSRVAEDTECPKCSSNNIKPNIVFFGEQAPKYMDMYKELEATMNKESIVVVIGTSGAVVNVNHLVMGVPCHAILCNMEKSKYISESNFNSIYYESIESSIDKVEEEIKLLWQK